MRPGPALERAVPRRREKLLAAAAALFAERGYGSVTLGDIGGAVGISGPAVYRHFKSKESLLGELLVEVSERLLASAKQRVAATTGPADAIFSLVDFHTGFAVDNAALITVQARELSSLAPDDQHQVRRLQRSYVELWADTVLRVAPVQSREEAVSAALATFGLLNSTPFSGRLEAQQMRARLRSMALAALMANVEGDARPIGQDQQKEGPIMGTNSTRLVRVVHHGPIGELVLDRPDAMNAISSAMAMELATACREIVQRPSVRAVVISSSTERAFSVGADLKERSHFTDAELTAQRPVMRAAFEAVRALDVPAIAAVAGYALGGGFEVALSCDLIVADDTAELALPETAVGLVPGGGGTQLLARRAGPGVAADFIFTARRARAPEALTLGLVDRVVPRGRARAVALELAEVIAAKSPVAVRAAKRAMRLGAGADLATSLEIEEAAWRMTETSPDRAEGIAAFVEKRPPNWPSQPPSVTP